MTDQQPPGDSVRTAVEQEWINLKERLDSLTGIIDKYSGDDDVVRADSSVRELKQIARSVAEDGKEMLQQARLLRLGIVGQVKAGKSSLLNLLLFDGQDVLPKAATPMTASLTHIVKSDRDEIEIEYYTPEDWEEIGKHADEYERARKSGDRNTPEFMQAARQLVEMADEKRISVHDHLGEKVVHEVPKAELNEQLRRFVGSDGDLTPLVKSVTIRTSEGVPDLDIVDTPGINDPIASRSRQAERMLARCDAVLLLSYAGQFMDAQDVRFFEQRIPQEGIRHRVVVGSKLDSALVDVSRDHGAVLDEAKDDTEKRLKAHASSAVARLNDASTTNDRPASEIILMSAMCAALSAKPGASWAPDERHAFDTLQRAYPDYLDRPDGEQNINQVTRDILARIGNRAEVEASLQEIRSDKDGIMAEKVTAFLREKHEGARKGLAELVGSLEERKALVEGKDIEDIEEQQKSIGALREELETQVAFAWESLIKKQGDAFDGLREEIRAAVAETREKIQGAVTTETRTKRKKKKGLWNALKRGVGAESGYKTKTYEKKVLDETAIENSAQRFCEDIEEEVDAVVGKMYDSRFRAEAIRILRQAVADSISNDLAARINMNALQRSLREAIARIVEEADERLRSTQKSLFDAKSLSFRYDGGGDSEAREFVKKARDKITRWLASCNRQIKAVQDQAKADLVPVTVDELNKYQERLKEDIANKEFILQRCDLALDELGQARRGLENSTGPNGG